MRPSEYRWRTPALVLTCGALVLALSLGIRHGFGLFLQPMSQEAGWGREVFALAIAVQNLVWGLAQPVTGMIADRWGAGRVIAAGGVLYTVGLLVMAASHSPVELTAGAGLLIGLGLSGTSFAVVFGAVSRVVAPERRSVAFGIAAATGSFGQFIMVPGSLALISGFGWALALVVLAGLAALMVPLAAVVDGGAAPACDRHTLTAAQALAEAFGQRDFWLLSFGFFVCGFQVVFISTHLPAFLVDQGLPLGVGTTVLALVGLFNVAGTWCAGVLGTRHRKPLLLALIYLGRAVVIALFVVVPVTPWSAYAFGIAMGVLWLSTVPLTHGTVAAIFGVRNVSMLVGIVFLFHQVGSFLGGWLGGYVYDRSGSYDTVWLIAIGLSLFAALINMPIQETPVLRQANREVGL